MKAIVLTFLLAAHTIPALVEAAESSGPDLNWASRIQRQVDAQASTVTRMQKQVDTRAVRITEIQGQVDSLLLTVQDVRVPTGTIVAFYGDKAPKGWLLCDGNTTPEEYKDLRKLVGERLPDLRGTFARGLGQDKGNSGAGRLINYIMKI